MSRVGGCLVLHVKMLCDAGVRVATITSRTKCDFSRKIFYVNNNTLTRTRGFGLLPNFEHFPHVQLQRSGLRPLHTIHCVGRTELLPPHKHIKPRYFSTQETFDSFLKMQAGLFRWLSESTAVGYAKESIIFIHETTGVPWWCSIMLTTVLLRTCLILPFTMYQNFISAKLENLTLEMPEIAKQLRIESTYAIKKLNWTEAQAKLAYIRSMRKQWNKLVVRDNCHPFKTIIVLWVQIALWVVYSTALRNMVYMLPDGDLAARVLNLELTVGGTLWFPNLTVVDASFILPVAFGLINLLIIELHEMTRMKKKTKFQKYLTNFFRGLSVIMVPIAAGVPSCLCLYWVTSCTTGLIHNLVVLSPRVRRLAGIPITPSELVHPYLHVKEQVQKKLSFKKNVEEH